MNWRVIKVIYAKGECKAVNYSMLSVERLTKPAK